MLAAIEQGVNRRLFRPRQWGIVDWLSQHDRADIYHCCTRVGGEAEWDVGEKAVKWTGHHHSLPSVLDALGAWEALEAPLEMPTECANSLEIRAWLQRWNVDSNKGGNFIICNG